MFSGLVQWVLFCILVLYHFLKQINRFLIIKIELNDYLDFEMSKEDIWAFIKVQKMKAERDDPTLNNPD
jgi:hypothetical protein